MVGDGVRGACDDAAVAGEDLVSSEDQVARAGLFTFARVLVIADHEVPLAVGRFGFAFAVHELHVDARELDGRLAPDSGGHIRDIGQDVFEGFQFAACKGPLCLPVPVCLPDRPRPEIRGAMRWPNADNCYNA